MTLAMHMFILVLNLVSNNEVGHSIFSVYSYWYGIYWIKHIVQNSIWMLPRSFFSLSVWYLLYCKKFRDN